MEEESKQTSLEKQNKAAKQDIMQEQMVTKFLNRLQTETTNEELKSLIASKRDAWVCFKLALSLPEMKLVALQNLQKLIAHQLIQGEHFSSTYSTDLQQYIDTIPQESPLKRTLGTLTSQTETTMDEIILVLIKINSKDVHLHLIQLFLTLVTGEQQFTTVSLVLILNECFRIYNESALKSMIETTAKASLTQMINLIFSKMERLGIDVREVKDIKADPLGLSIDHLAQLEDHHEDKVFSDDHESTEAPAEEEIAPVKVAIVVAKEETVKTGPVHRKRSFDSHDAAELELLKKDVLATLKYLASVASHKDETSNHRLRELTLELMLSVLNNLGQVFLKDDRFLDIIRDDVCAVISQNSITTNPVLFELSLSIFLLLIRFYRHKLVLEVESQFVLYLQILEMGNSTYKQKSNILQGLLKICENPQTLMDIYLNYDCEFESSSIYEKIIMLCSKITQGRGESAIVSTKGGSSRFGFSDSKQDLAKQQDRRLFLRALCILNAAIQSLVTWYEASEDDLNTPGRERPNPVVGKNPLLNVVMDTNNTEVDKIVDGKAERILSKKQKFKNAVELFNTNPKKGMKLFFEGEFVREDPIDVANFLRTTTDLSKTAIGDYIGEGGSFFLKVMHEFVDSLDFTSMEFVQALRNFLQTFRLPGEAQKIDRLMEKFADRYCESNPNIFAKADTAYTLAFSVIMLNTDQHSPEIKHKMDKPAFIKNNKGINGDEDLPQEFMEAIFDEIKKNEIIMENEASEKLRKMTMGWGAGELNEKKRLETYRKEVAAMAKTNLLNTVNTRTVNTFKTATKRELAKTMFSCCAWAIMAAFSLSFESADQVVTKVREPDVGELCLDGILGSIKISCWFHLETEKDAFVSTLSKLTGLSHFYEIKLKNTVAINKLIEVAVGMGKRMDTAWIEIITALSQLEKMQVAVLKGEPLQAINVEEKSDGYVELAPQAQKVSKILETFVNEMQSQNSIILIDKIFTTSVQLSAHSIIHFFTAVCSVSLEEVGMNINGEVITSNPPRMYLLQKIVEIAYYNMHRIRFEWTQIWRILQPHFNIVACHPDIRVANFAVDSLRQMGMKFLEKDELGQFSTQHEYLKSFEFIIKHNNAPVIRELILNSLSQMINARASRIKSGWKSIFVTLVRAAQTDEKLAQSSFKTIQVIFNQHFDEVVSTGAFVDMVSCLAECALLPGQGPVHDELVMSSIQMLQSCTKSLMERAKDQVDDALLPTVRINNLPTQPYLLLNGCISEEHFYLSWFPILSAFSRVVTESDDLLVRTHTMEILFEIFKTSGPLFDAPYWKKISRNIVNPIFDDLNDQEAASARESNSAVLIHGLRLLVSLVSEHFVLFLDLAKAGDSSSTDFLYSCIDRMVELMTKPDDNLASLGQTCFQQFLLLNAAKFDDKTWIWVSSRIEKSFRITMPSELIECDVHGPKDGLVPVEISSVAKKGSTGNVVLLDNLDFGKTVVKCVTHKELLLTIKEFCQLKIANHGAVIAIMPSESRHIILSSLYSSYAIARLFNSMTTLRQAIHKKGWVAQLPNLVDQETISFSTYLQALFQIIKSNDDLEYQESLAKELKDLFQRYIALLKDPERNKQHLRSWGPVVAFNLKELGTVKELWKKDGPLKDSLDEIYRDSVRMTITENHDVRAMLIELLLDIGEIFLTK